MSERSTTRPPKPATQGMLLGVVLHQKHTFQQRECAYFPAAQRHQTLQAPSPGPSKQILAQGANSASLAPPARLVEGRGREGKKRHTFEALNLREAGARLAPFAPCAKICSDGSGLGACQVWWRCAAGKGAHSCSWT